MALWEILTILISFINFVHASPVVAYPLNSQVPPVARVSKPFLCAFSSSTFSSQLSMTYTLSSGPSWLSLDGHTRTLHGTPSIEDVGRDTITGVPIGLTATDASGSTTLNATLVISKNAGPTMEIPLAQQMLSSNSFSAPSTLLYHPSTPFKFKFDENTFNNGGSSSGLQYYAVTSDNTPLPSWILFDEGSLTFNGQTPDYQSLIQPPQTFGIQLIASDVQGFAGTSLFFDIEVGVHLLAFKNAHIAINATSGEKIRYDGLLSNIQFDGSSATMVNIFSISANSPPWLSIDNSSLVLSGTVPADAAPTNFTIQATDIYGDMASSQVTINIPTALFKTPLGALNATTSTSFSYDLSVFLLNKSDIIMTAQFSPAVTWISFDPKSFLMTGQVPPSLKASLVVVSLVAVSKLHQTSESQSFDLSIYPGILTVSTSPTSPSHKTSTSSISTQTTSSTATQSLQPKHLSKKLLMGILIPVGLALVAMVLAIFCCWRRRRAAKDKNYAEHPLKHEISAPLDVKSSVAEIVGVQPIHIKAPEPLKLDMAGFSEPRHTAILSNEPTEPLRSLKNQTMKRSQTMSIASDAQRSRLRHSDLSGSRGRAYSENALSRTEKSSRMTRNSVLLTGSSRANSTATKRWTRDYSNYSRKGHARRSVMIPEVDVLALKKESNATKPETRNTILNLRDSNFSSTPLDKFSALPPQASTTHSSIHMWRTGKSESLLSARRHSRFKAVLVGRAPSTIGIGHGGRNSIVSVTNTERKRRSIGHGQDWSSNYTHQGQPTPDSNNWVTVSVAGVNLQNRCSIRSTSSAYSDGNNADVAPLRTIRKVTKSPEADLATFRSVSSSNPRYSRPVSRAIQSSPFFAGSSFRASRRSPKKTRTSYADSPTVPEGTTTFGRLHKEGKGNVLQELREEGHNDELLNKRRDSFGVTYGRAQEGTRQLRSFIKSRMTRPRSRGSEELRDGDSRFASAAELNVENVGLQQQIPGRGDEEREMGFDDYVVEAERSVSSWETQVGEGEGDTGGDEMSEESEGNVIRFYEEIREEEDELPMPNPGFMSMSRQTSQSLPSSPILGKKMGMRDEESPSPRIVMGRGQRPTSVNAKAFAGVGGNGVGRVERSMRDEMDYSAYI